MRFLISCAAAIVIGVALLAACTSNDKQTAAKRNANANANAASDPSMPIPPTDGVTRITIADAKAAVDQGTAILVDTRPAGAYAQEHIKGAINIVDGEIEAHLNQLPPDKKIIAYCS